MIRRDILKFSGALAMSPLTPAVSQTFSRSIKNPDLSTSFKPGRIWLDTAGKPIQAHGGSIIRVNGLFYWYGENKEKTLPHSGIWHWGVRAYSSRDLYNWDDIGLIIPPDTEDIKSPLHPSRMLDRPHIIFNSKTNQYVCWVKLMEPDFTQTRTVLVADKFTGPYRIIKTGIRPFGMSAGDFDLAVSPDDGKAYMYFERVHSEMICADLNDEFTDFENYYSTHFPGKSPPTVREGPAHFHRKGKHYLVTSGTTGYYPNPSEIAVADTFHGPWTVIGNLHPRDRSLTSYNSQIASVFKHPAKKDLYIALADRWMGPLQGTSFESGSASREMQNVYAKKYGREKQSLSSDEEKVIALTDFNLINTSLARYVWLPISFIKDVPVIDWRDEWKLDEFV